MRVYEAKLVYSLVSLGDNICLNTPAAIADYLRSAFEENPMQEALYCIYLDRKNHPLGRHMITLGTATSTLATPREVFRCAILAGATALVVAHRSVRKCDRQRSQCGIRRLTAHHSAEQATTGRRHHRPTLRLSQRCEVSHQAIASIAEAFRRFFG